MSIPLKMKEIIIHKKKLNPQLSLRWLADRMEVSSGRLSEILNGKRPLKEHYLEKFCVALKLSQDEIHNFRREFQSPEAAKKTQDSFGPVLGENEIDALADWKAFAFLSFLQTTVYEAISARCFTEQEQIRAIAGQFKLSVEEIRDLLVTMINLKLVEWKNNQYKPIYSEATTGFDIPSEARRLWHRRHLELAQKRFLELDVTERDFSAITFTMDQKNILRGKKMIRNFRRNFSRAMEAKKGEGVYQMSIQLFPIIKPGEGIV